MIVLLKIFQNILVALSHFLRLSSMSLTCMKAPTSSVVDCGFTASHIYFFVTENVKKPSQTHFITWVTIKARQGSGW